MLGFSETGLDLIEGSRIQDRSILVTSRFEEPQIRDRCDRLGIRLIPKGMAAYVPLQAERPKIAVDAILIDDDPLMHLLWLMAGKEKGKSVAAFASPEAFFEKAGLYAREVPVYVDVSLPNGVRGEFVAEQVHAAGFHKIWLATGHSPETVTRPACVRGVIGKAPPF